MQAKAEEAAAIEAHNKAQMDALKAELDKEKAQMEAALNAKEAELAAAKAGTGDASKTAELEA